MRTLLITLALAVLLGLGLYLLQPMSGDRTRSAPTGTEPVVGRTAPPDREAATEPAGMNSRLARPTPKAQPPAADSRSLRTDSAFQGLFFAAERGLIDLADALRQAQQQIESGAPGGRFDLARVIGNCTLAEEASQLTADAAAADLPGDVWTRELKQALAECAPVLAAVPEGLTAAEWQRETLEAAAGEGDPLAALELAVDHTPGDQSYADVLALAQVVAQSGDYRGYFLVADFLAEFHDPAGADINEPRAMQWSLLGCRRSPLCEPEIFEAQLALDFTPAEVAAFREFAIDQERRMADGEPLALEPGWLPLEAEATD